MSLDAWGTTKSSSDPMRPTLVARAMKRHVADGGGKTWVVQGNSALNDNYDEYLVRETRPARDPVDAEYLCDCSSHSHGEARRRACSHVTAAILYRQGKISRVYEAGEGGEAPNPTNLPRLPSLTTLPPVPIPIPVELDPYAAPSPSALGLEYDPPMPTKFSHFKHTQWPTINAVVDAFAEGYKVVFLDAPTGSGKTLVAESVRRMMNVQGLYTCTTKTLQDQVMRDFGEYAKLIKGRANYPTLDDPLTAADECVLRKRPLPACDRCPGGSSLLNWRDNKGTLAELIGEASGKGWHCAHCHPTFRCPYQVAKREAGEARLAVLNTAYFMSECNYFTRTPFRNKGLVILDEADQLEKTLMGFVEVEISARMRKMLGVGLPQRKGDEEAWVEWIKEEMIPAGEAHVKVLAAEAKNEVEFVKKSKTLIRLIDRLGWLVEEPVKAEFGDLESERTLSGHQKSVLESGWVYTGYEGKGEAEATVQFKPVKVDKIAQDFLWKHAQKFLCMSASFVGVEGTAAELGLEDGEWTSVSMPSTFPVQRRPILPVGSVSVTHKNKDVSYGVVADEVDRVLDLHPSERILVHTVSYDLGQTLYDRLSQNGHRRRLHTYYNAGKREEALKRYLADPRGVMLAPSFDRGVDLQGDECRVIVIPKVPFGNVGDKQVKTRLYGTGRSGRVWYVRETIRTIVQMTGRGMRSIDDECITYILDKEFLRLFNENRRLFPEWWREAIVWDANDPKWAEVRDLERLARAMEEG